MSDRDTNAPDTTSNVPDTTRPVTSKPRGTCKYFNTSRGCYAGDRCKFLHGHPLTPYDQSKTCKFYASGWCSRGDKCWFIHAEPSKPSSSSSEQDSDEEEQLCSICYDKPVTYGLLIGCSHVFCLPCIKNWRGSEGKSSEILEAGTTKTCPMCRTTSRYVTPSSLFFAEGDPRKAEAIEKYKNSMARVKCRYFERSSRKRFCPFGKDCFFKHENDDGTPYVFSYGVEHYMGRRRSRDDDEDDFTPTWDPDGSRLEAMLTTIIGNAHFSSGAMRRAVLSSIAAVFGTDTLPPIYSLDDDSGQEEEELIPVPPSVDQSEAVQAQADEDWEDWLTNTIVVSPPSEDHDIQSASSAVFSPALSAPPSLQASSGATLDPTSPEFVPSFLLDTMRPLPPGPSRTHGRVEDDPDNSFAVSGASSAPEDRLSNVHDWEERQRNGEVLLAATSSTLAPESSSSAAPAQTDSDGRADLVVQDADPPFMTDGRGRVVWSSTTISRGREGRRGRAASSSATIVPHPKTTPDLSAAEETSEEASQHESPRGRSASASGRLVRQRSLPLVGYGHGADGGTHPAEFMTDGRGRVVFASSR